MSLSSILSIARSALLLHQKSVDVAAHNIANVSTEGYARQRLDLKTAEPLRTPLGAIGRGLTDGGIRRAHDQFLDASLRQESGLLGRFNTMQEHLESITEVLGEPADGGIAASLDALLDAFSDLANDPTSGTARTLVRQNAEGLVQRFQSSADRLSGLQQDVVQRLQGAVNDVNSYAQEIAELNRQIGAMAAGVEAPDLADRRDLLIDRLSKLMDVQVVSRPNGAVALMAGSALLVDGPRSSRIEVRELPAGGHGIGVEGTDGTFGVAGGEMSALLELSGSTLPSVQRQLDQFARAVMTEVNAIHRTGRTPGGAMNTDFFDPAGTTARTITIAAPIRQSAEYIAAGTTGNAGDGSVALAIAGLRSTPAASAGGQTLGEYYTSIISSVGALARAAEQSKVSQETLVGNVQARRSAVRDVSIEEEMIQLTKGQQAFAAASKVVQAADEMMQSVLQMV